jgi:hypothetical protein
MPAVGRPLIAVGIGYMLVRQAVRPRVMDKAVALLEGDESTGG